MPTTRFQPAFVLIFRLLMAWTFLYAASTQVLNPTWNVSDFLAATKTFHDVYGVFSGAAVAGIVALLVAWGHLLIGLSLAIGLMVRLSATVGAILFILYWAAFMDFPYVGGPGNFIVDFHFVYAIILLYLAAVGGGKVFGLDPIAERMAIDRNSRLRPLFA